MLHAFPMSAGAGLGQAAPTATGHGAYRDVRHSGTVGEFADLAAVG